MVVEVAESVVNDLFPRGAELGVLFLGLTTHFLYKNVGPAEERGQDAILPVLDAS